MKSKPSERLDAEIGPDQVPDPAVKYTSGS